MIKLVILVMGIFLILMIMGVPYIAGDSILHTGRKTHEYRLHHATNIPSVLSSHRLDTWRTWSRECPCVDRFLRNERIRSC